MTKNAKPFLHHNSRQESRIMLDNNSPTSTSNHLDLLTDAIEGVQYISAIYGL